MILICFGINNVLEENEKGMMPFKDTSSKRLHVDKVMKTKPRQGHEKKKHYFMSKLFVG